jgi:hypothetical protein
MSLVNWESGVSITYDDKDDEQQALMLMLTRDYTSISQWTGKVVTKKFTGRKHKSVQLRKQMHGTNILIEIGIKAEMGYNIGQLAKESLICVSASGRMNYSLDEITELNLVIKEAYSVYCNLDKE